MEALDSIRHVRVACLQFIKGGEQLRDLFGAEPRVVGARTIDAIDFQAPTENEAAQQLAGIRRQPILDLVENARGSLSSRACAAA